MQKIDLSKFVGERCKVTYRNGKTANCLVRSSWISGEYKVGTRNHFTKGVHLDSNYDIVAIEVIK